MSRWLQWLWLVGTLFVGAPALASAPLDVVIVPGCPSNADGSVSICQWERAIWASELWQDGATGAFITSGGAVYNAYIEAEAVATAMVALGVPRDRIHLETQALHSDENLGYSMAIARELEFDDVGYATHGLQATALRAMVRGWGQRDVAHLPMDRDRVERRLEQGLPMVWTAAVPPEEWLPINDRERVVAARLGRPRRLPSWVVYAAGATVGWMKRGAPPVPPVVEPTLRGLRHRVDTAAWDSDALVSVE